MKLNIITHTGSRYTVRVDAENRFWFSGLNVPNAESCTLPEDREWEIEQPMCWPPTIGEPLYAVSKYFCEPKDHPERIPGGGKITSLIVCIEEEGVAA